MSSATIKYMNVKQEEVSARAEILLLLATG